MNKIWITIYWHYVVTVHCRGGVNMGAIATFAPNIFEKSPFNA